MDCNLHLRAKTQRTPTVAMVVAMVVVVAVVIAMVHNLIKLTRNMGREGKNISIVYRKCYSLTGNTIT